MFPQSKVDEYIGKQGATVPSVRMITLFCPARQFHSVKRSSPFASCTMPGVWARISLRLPLVPVPSPHQPYFFKSSPDDMRTNAFISSTRCTESTHCYPALIFSMIQSINESTERQSSGRMYVG